MTNLRRNIALAVSQRAEVLGLPTTTWQTIPFVIWPLTWFAFTCWTKWWPTSWFTFALFMIWMLALAVGPVLIYRYWKYVLRQPSGPEKQERTNNHRDANRGMAANEDLWAITSATAMRAQATQVRPSLTGYDLSKVDVTEYAVHLADAAISAGPYGQKMPVYQSLEDCTLTFGAPRQGKTVGVVNRILDAPGALIAASTKLELCELTATYRQQFGDIYIFNPMSYGGWLTNFHWPVLSGCTDLATAKRRAVDMIKSALGNDKFFTDQARTFLGILLHVVALKGGNILDVKKWFVDAPPTDPKVKSVMDNLRRVMRDLEIDDGVFSAMSAYYTTTERTRSGWTATMAGALAWTSNPTAMACSGGTADSLNEIDFERFLNSRDSLYIVSSQDLGDVTALASAMLAEFAEQSRRISQNAFGMVKRIDPATSMILDEVRLSCPQVPLESWTADFGGKGVTLHIVAQSPADLRKEWGDDALDIIATNCTIMIHGGIKGPKDMPWLSSLFGRYSASTEEGSAGQEDVFSGADLAGLPKFEVVIRMTGIRAIHGVVPKFYLRRDYAQIMADPTKRWRPTMIAGSDVVASAEELLRDLASEETD